MVIMKPKGCTLESMVGAKQFSGPARCQNFLDDIKDANRPNLELHMPKFDFPSSTKLLPILESMGLGEMFRPAKDSFANLCDGPAGVSDVLHDAVVRVDEKGTEAAAATVVVMLRGMAMPQAPPTIVEINEPFCFWITDRISGTILFSGRMYNPVSK